MEGRLLNLLEPLVARNVFGDGRLTSAKPDPGEELGFQFMSQLTIANVTIRRSDGQLNNIPVVIKVQCPENEAFGRDSDTMFANEVIMYTELLPLLNVNNDKLYAKLYYAEATRGREPLKDVIVVENLKPLGYEQCRQQLFLDYEHIRVAMEKIGKFHSWSFSCKARANKKFKELSLKLKLPKTFDGSEEILYACMKRGIEPFSGRDSANLMKLLNVLHTEKAREFLYSPSEPFDTVIHGDFCRNNVFYKYDENGNPVDIALFDFQFSFYGCPVVDLSFFLYMHTTAEIRDKYWDNFLEVYWRSVMENVGNNVPLPDYEEFLKYFASRAVYGYIPCCFFLPMMYKPADIMSPEEFEKATVEEKAESSATVGGEKGTKLLKDIVSHLLENKYVEAFLELYERHNPS